MKGALFKKGGWGEGGEGLNVVAQERVRGYVAAQKSGCRCSLIRKERFCCFLEELLLLKKD
jgi:hypothetical protein